MRISGVLAYAARWWWLCLVLALLCGGAAWLLYPHLPMDGAKERYMASTELPLIADLDAASRALEGVEVFRIEELSPTNPDAIGSEALRQEAFEAFAALVSVLPADLAAPGANASASPMMTSTYVQAQAAMLDTDKLSDANLPAAPEGAGMDAKELKRIWNEHLVVEVAPAGSVELQQHGLAVKAPRSALRISGAPSPALARAALDGYIIALWRNQSDAVQERIFSALQRLESNRPADAVAVGESELQLAREQGARHGAQAAARLRAIRDARINAVDSHIEPVEYAAPETEASALAYAQAWQDELQRRFAAESELVLAADNAPDLLRGELASTLADAERFNDLAAQVQAREAALEAVEADAEALELVISGLSGEPVESFEPASPHVQSLAAEMLETARAALANARDAARAGDDDRLTEAEAELKRWRETLRATLPEIFDQARSDVAREFGAIDQARDQVLASTRFAMLAEYVGAEVNDWKQLGDRELFMRAADTLERWDGRIMVLAGLARGFDQAQATRDAVAAAQAARAAEAADWQRNLQGVRAISELAGGTPPAEAWSQAAQRHPVALNRTRLTGIAAIAGLVFSTFFVLVSVGRRKRVFSESDVEHHLGVSVIAHLEGESGKRVELARESAEPSLRTAYRALASLLESTAKEFSLKTVAVTDLSAGMAATAIAGSVAITLAEQGQNVLLMDADFAASNLGELFEQRNPRRGLTREMVDAEERIGLADLVSASGREGLDLMLQRERIASASGFVRSTAFEDLLADASEEYDLVILASGEVVAAETQAIVGACDATLVSASLGEVAFRQAEIARKLLDDGEANVLGVVLAGKGPGI